MPFSLGETVLASSYRGLSTVEAEIASREYGKNIRPAKKSRTSFQLLFSIVAQPMLIILITTTVVYFFIGSHEEAAIFAFSIIPIILMEFFQERRTDHAIQLLDNMLVEECRVYRDGILKQMEVSEIVPGDLVYLSSGDKIPADGILLRSPGLMVDEAILTGESVPVVKSAFQNEMTESVKLLQGTMVVQGEGQMLVMATGGETQYGKLGNLLEGIAEQQTPLQKKVNGLVRQLAIGAVAIAVLVGVLLGYEQGWVSGLLGALTISMSIIPEEFPVVFSVFLIMGVWRLSKRNALARKMVMVETLGSVTTICADKTGTLTEGKMSIDRIYAGGKLLETKELDHLPEVVELIEAASLALEQIAVDPMEIELQRFAKTKKIISENYFSNYKLLKDSTFSSVTKTVNHTWQNKNGDVHQFTAGAPEAVLNASANADKKAVQTYEKLAAEGYRIVAIAKTRITKYNEFKTSGLTFLGFIVMSDPPRYGVKDAIEVCKTAGIKVKMITGDHALTARALAQKIGLDITGEVVEGKDLDGLDQASIRELVANSNIFARVRPEHKYMLVEALQASGEIVAMTGDGVNDAPALKKATVGIAMGEKGTSVARAAAGIILLDDNFTTIVHAVEEGRRIYDNLRAAFVFLFSFHLPIIGLSIVPLILWQGFYFLPIHIIFLELFGDPATVIGLERDPIAKGTMRMPPRDPKEPLINKKLWWRIGWQAAGILGLTLVFYAYGLWTGNIVEGRTLSFMALVISQVVLVLISRDRQQVKQNYVLNIILLLTVVCVHLVVFIPSVSSLFHFSPPEFQMYLYMLIASMASMLFFNKIAKKDD